MKILVVNAGSSSLKYQLIDMQTEKVLAKGGCERIGIRGAFLKAKGNGGEKIYKQSMPDHKEAIRLVLDALMDEEIGVIKSMKEIDAVGHRIVASGEYFKDHARNSRSSENSGRKDLRACSPAQSFGGNCNKSLHGRYARNADGSRFRHFIPYDHARKGVSLRNRLQRL